MDTTKTIGQIVADDFRAAEIFKNAGIDFCCGGRKSVEQACKEQNISVEELVGKLESLPSTGTGAVHNFKDWDLEFLIDYIVNTHHKKERTWLDDLAVYTQKIADVHGENHPELKEIASLYELVYADLLPHFLKEEQVLFPAVKELIATGSPQAKSLVQCAIQAMMSEHDAAGAALDKINVLSNKYTLPADACNTYVVTYKLLEELEDDIHVHIHLENNVLFPKALELTK